jgi:predicted DNA-binding ribbon-helix-helix protein
MLGNHSVPAGTVHDEILKRGEARGTGEYLRSRVVKRSIMVGRHKTSVSLEDVFWNELRVIAQNLDVHLSQLVARIDVERQHCNLSSAIRLFVFEHRCRHPDMTAHPQADLTLPGPGGRT